MVLHKASSQCISQWNQVGFKQILKLLMNLLIFLMMNTFSTLKNNHRLVIRNLNINSISNKFGNLKLIIQGKIYILVMTETKTDSIFPLNQFAMQGYSKP